jgi:hypothetical protein
MHVKSAKFWTSHSRRHICHHYFSFLKMQVARSSTMLVPLYSITKVTSQKTVNLHG